VLPEAPRNRARALGAQLRRADPSHSVAEPGLDQAWYLSTQFQAMLAGTRRPSSWQLWLDQMQAVALYRNGGVAGAPDDELYRDAARFAERFGAPQGVRDVIAFRRGIAVWDFRMAADAADRLIPLALREHRWIAPDELRDGAVMAHLHLHQVAAARAALDALAPFSGRPPDHLVSLLLDAYVRFAEWRQAKLGGALARVGP
jgi:hypothetical protein